MVKIVTDSSCDISLERCAELGVELLPITVNFGDQSYRANLDITTEEFYDKLAAARSFPRQPKSPPPSSRKSSSPIRRAATTWCVCSSPPR